MALIRSNKASAASGNPVLNVGKNKYCVMSFVNGFTSEQNIVSGTAIALDNGIVYGNIEDFNTAATYGQAITYNFKVSNDGVTWTTVAAGSDNIASYKYFMATTSTSGVTVTFT